MIKQAREVSNTQFLGRELLWKKLNINENLIIQQTGSHLNYSYKCTYLQNTQVLWLWNASLPVTIEWFAEQYKYAVSFNSQVSSTTVYYKYNLQMLMVQSTNREEEQERGLTGES